MNTSMLNSPKSNYKDNLDYYDHYLALDWSQASVALARMTQKSHKIKVVEWRKSDLKALKEYLFSLKGKKILTIEETTSSHWLYVELTDVVDRIVICDPYCNHLLSDGPKTDKYDAMKLCRLLRGGFLKEVFHSCDRLYHLRHLLSAYEDLVKAGVRVQNQRNALYRARGMRYSKCDKTEQQEVLNRSGHYQIIIDWQESLIEKYREDKASFEAEIKKIVNGQSAVKNIMALPGIGYINAFKILAVVIQPQRFAKKGSYLSYCGLVWLEKSSGDKNYGKRRPRYNRLLKEVYKNAAYTAIQGGHNPVYEYYQTLIAKGLTDKQAHQMVSRYLAKVSLSMLKNGRKYEPYRWRKDEITAA